MKVSAGTIARTTILAIALVNQVMTATGHSVINVSDEEINTLISTGFTVITAIVTWWKNNSFTKEAVAADKLMQKLKSGDSNENN